MARRRILGLTGAPLMGALSGLTLGALTGMSSEPVVASIIAAVFASAPVVSLYVNLADKKASVLNATRSFLQYQIVGLTCAFFLFLLAGTALGIFVRKSNFFFGSPYAIERRDMEAAGIDKTVAREILEGRLKSAEKLPGRPEILFSYLDPDLPLCRTKPSQTSDNYRQVVAQFVEAGGMWRELVSKLDEVTVPGGAPAPVDEEMLKRHKAYGFLEAAWLIAYKKVGVGK